MENDDSNDPIEREKSQGIGGTDIGAIIGVNPWKTAFGVYTEKLGLVPPREQTLRMKLGLVLEPALVRLYEEEHGVKVIKPGFLRLADHPIILGHPDGLVVGDTAPAPPGIEIKVVGERVAKHWGEPGTDQAPPYVISQVSWYAALTGRPIWDVVGLFNGDEARTYRVHVDFELVAMLVAQAEEFWNRYVVTQTPPPIDASSDAKRYLDEKFPRERVEIRAATDEDWMLARVLYGARKRYDEAEEIKRKVENEIKLRIGDAAGIEAINGFRFTWKRAKDSVEIDWEAVAKDLAVPRVVAEAVKKHTHTKEGSRRFLPKFDGGFE
jgi:putative phage-type endonuclease